MLRNWLREPLLHFLLIGVAVFVVYDRVVPSVPDGGTILVSVGEQQAMRARFINSWHRQPSAAEMQNLIDDYVLDEVYVREAQSIGLDRDDPGIRQRLRLKMAYLLGEAAMELNPDADQIATFYQDHPDLFRAPPRYSFQQILLPANADAALVAQDLSRLTQGQPVADQASLLARDYQQQTASQLQSVFGDSFVTQLETLPPGHWQGPVSSAQGQHLVRVVTVTPGVLPALADIRDEVIQRWLEAQKNQRLNTINNKLLARYRVKLEPVAPDQNG